MEVKLKKRLVTAMVLVIAIACLAAGVQSGGGIYQRGESKKEAKKTEDLAEDYETADAGLTFWYADADYGAFFEQASRDYYEATGIKVQPVRKESLDYIGEVYSATMEDGIFPDVYLLAGDLLEEAYLYGLAVEERDAVGYEGVCEQALLAAVYDNRRIAYPLSFNGCVFVYQNGYFAQQPASLQAIIDYSNENEPPENVEYLLEWDVNDPFFDFPFIANSVRFEKNEQGSFDVVCDEALYQKDLEYFSGILQSFSMQADTVSRDKVIEDFLAGKTLCAIVDTKSIKDLEGHSYSMMQMPRLNEELASGTCAMTDMLVVNGFSGQKDEAADFARFVMLEEADQLWEMTGYYPVRKSKNLVDRDIIAYDAYENAALSPGTIDALDFWITLQETIRKYF